MDDMRRVDLSLRRAHDEIALLLAHIERRRVFMDQHTAMPRVVGECLGVPQRMDEEAVRVLDALEITLGLEHHAGLLGREQLEPFAEIAQHHLDITPRAGGVVDALRHDHAVTHMDGLVEARHLAPHIFGAVGGEPVKRLGVFQAHLLDEVLDTEREAIADEAAIAARRSPGNALGLEQNRDATAPLHLHGSGEPGEPAADHADISGNDASGWGARHRGRVRSPRTRFRRM
jgi:hypothetical protein